MIQNYELVNEFIQKMGPDLLSKLVYQPENDKYVLYKQYYIQKDGPFYIVYRYRDDQFFKFTSLRNATAWSTLDWYNKIFEAKRVYELDHSLASINVDKLIHRRLKTRGPVEIREISRDKLLFDISKQRQFQWELDKYIIMARRCQQKGFENELTRTARK